jgi:hypothetical protein
MQHRSLVCIDKSWSSTCRLLLFRQDQVQLSLVEETPPGAAHDSVVKTSPGEAQAQCLDNSECSTSVVEISTRAAQATVVQTCPGAAQTPVLWWRHHQKQ